MADLLTHYVTGRIAGAGMRRRASALLFAVGTLFPDLMGKPLGFLMTNLLPAGEVPTHTPLGLVFLCYATSFLFVPEFRRAAFWMLYAGSLLHLLVDAMKDYLGRGSVYLLHPFSLEAYELGIYRTEDVFIFLPANLGILALLWWSGRRRESASGRYSADFRK